MVNKVVYKNVVISIDTSDKEVMFSSLFVRLSVSNFAQKLPNGFARNFQGMLAMGQQTNH